MPIRACPELAAPETASATPSFSPGVSNKIRRPISKVCCTCDMSMKTIEIQQFTVPTFVISDGSRRPRICRSDIANRYPRENNEHATEEMGANKETSSDIARWLDFALKIHSHFMQACFTFVRHSSSGPRERPHITVLCRCATCSRLQVRPRSSGASPLMMKCRRVCGCNGAKAASTRA